MFSAFSKPQYPQDNFLKIGQCNFHTQTVEFSANSASNQNFQIQCKVCVLQKIELVQILLARSHSAKCIILVKIQCKFCPQVKMQLVQSTWSKKTSAISFKVLVQSMQCKFPSVKSVEPRKMGLVQFPQCKITPIILVQNLNFKLTSAFSLLVQKLSLVQIPQQKKMLVQFPCL